MLAHMQLQSATCVYKVLLKKMNLEYSKTCGIPRLRLGGDHFCVKDCMSAACVVKAQVAPNMRAAQAHIATP